VHAALPGRVHHMQPIAENLDNWKWKYPVIEIKRAA
jgi:hypothetical protein